MKKLLLLVFLGLSLTASAYIKGAAGGEKTVQAAVHGERVDAVMEANKKQINFSWQCQHWVDQNEQTLTLWAETHKGLDYMVDYFSIYGYGFGCVEPVTNGFKAVAVLSYDETHAGAYVTIAEADESFYLAPKGSYVIAGE